MSPTEPSSYRLRARLVDRLAAAGAMATVFIDALSYLAVAAALLWWRTTTVQADNLPREHLSGALRAGIRFALHSKPLRYTLIRALAFFTCASAYWALLPIVAKETLHGGPDLYGVLLTALGLGAVAGAFMLPQLRKRYSANTNLILATLGTAFCLIMFALGQHIASGILAGFIGGVSWIVAVSTLNYSAQVALPDWVRARGLAIFQMAVFGAMAGGSLGWGQAAIVSDLPSSLIASGLLALALIAITHRFKLNLGEHHDHTPSGHWAEPVPVTAAAHDSGPVLVTLEYRIVRPDGDVELSGTDDFSVAHCADCGGVLKPHVVFFGENVPPDRVTRCYAAVDALRESDGALLVAGSSLAVMSGLRFVKRAASHGVPVVVVNRGTTRGDDLAAHRLHAGCSEFLTALADLRTAAPEAAREA